PLPAAYSRRYNAPRVVTSIEAGQVQKRDPMRTGRVRLDFVSTVLVALALRAGAQTNDYARAVKALEPDHYYRLDELELGQPKLDDNGDPIPVVNAGGFQYDDQVIDEGTPLNLINGYHEGKFEPLDTEPPFALVGADGPFGLCGFDDTNKA